MFASQRNSNKIYIASFRSFILLRQCTYTQATYKLHNINNITVTLFQNVHFGDKMSRTDDIVSPITDTVPCIPSWKRTMGAQCRGMQYIMHFRRLTRILTHWSSSLRCSPRLSILLTARPQFTPKCALCCYNCIPLYGIGWSLDYVAIHCHAPPGLPWVRLWLPTRFIFNIAWWRIWFTSADLVVAPYWGVNRALPSSACSWSLTSAAGGSSRDLAPRSGYR